MIVIPVIQQVSHLQVVGAGLGSSAKRRLVALHVSADSRVDASSVRAAAYGQLAQNKV